MKLGFISETTNNAYYRSIIPMRELERRGHTILWPRQFGAEMPLRDLLRCDLVHCYRRTDRIDDLQALSSRGVPVAFDNDDNYAVAEVSAAGPGLAGHRYNRRLAKDTLKAASIADLTIVPSAALAEHYRHAANENVAVLENHLERSMLGFGSGSRHDGVVIGWTAGGEHRTDLERLPIVQVLERLLALHADLRVLTIGLRLPLRSERYEHVPTVPFPQLLKFTSRMDIGIAPLANTAFNRSRSNVKLKEYASGGAAWLASPVGSYRPLGEGQGGLLVGDEEWLRVLGGLIGSRRVRKRLARRALRWAKRETIDCHVEGWESALLATVARVRGDGS